MDLEEYLGLYLGLGLRNFNSPVLGLQIFELAHGFIVQTGVRLLLFF